MTPTALLPQTTATAAIVLQFFYWLISAIGVILFIKTRSALPKIFIAYFLCSLFFLLVSEPILRLAEPMIPITSWALTQNSSQFWFFLTNILFLIIIIQMTGKMLNSIFTPMLSVLPVLAIFLHESIGKILLYTVIILIFYLFSNVNTNDGDRYNGYDSEGARRKGIVTISILSLLMSIIIGMITK